MVNCGIPLLQGHEHDAQGVCEADHELMSCQMEARKYSTRQCDEPSICLRDMTFRMPKRSKIGCMNGHESFIGFRCVLDALNYGCLDFEKQLAVTMVRSPQGIAVVIYYSCKECITVE